jgi:hypothetical protein
MQTVSRNCPNGVRPKLYKILSGICHSVLSISVNAQVTPPKQSSRSVS